MKYLKLYENFKGDIDTICRDYGISNYVINRDESVDVNENVFIDNRDLKTFPFKFGKIRGGFYCVDNKLITLKNGPIEVSGDFSCSSNKLTTLEYGPKIVNGNYYCISNNLKDVTGFPHNFHGVVNAHDNPVYEIIHLVLIDLEEVFIRWLNEFDVIRDGNKIVEMRLEEAYWMAMKEELPMNKRKFENYTLI